MRHALRRYDVGPARTTPERAALTGVTLTCMAAAGLIFWAGLGLYAGAVLAVLP
jgi:hypothetical protein